MYVAGTATGGSAAGRISTDEDTEKQMTKAGERRTLSGSRGVF